MLSIAFGSVICPAQAQTQARDVVYLKNGSIIKGKITEIIPDTSVKIQTADGSIYAYSMSEVKKITDGPNTYGVTVLGGISEPVVYFGDQYGEKAGRAKTGCAVGIDFSRYLAPNIAWMTSANLSVLRPQNYSLKNWYLGWLLTGWKVAGNPSPKVELFGFAQAGLLYVSIPGLWISSDSIRGISAPYYSFGFGLGAGLNIDNTSLSLRLLCSEPEYDVTYVVTDTVYINYWPYQRINDEIHHGTYKQPTYCIQIAGGYNF
jgi:hypothetical protein